MARLHLRRSGRSGRRGTVLLEYVVIVALVAGAATGGAATGVIPVASAMSAIVQHVADALPSGVLVAARSGSLLVGSASPTPAASASPDPAVSSASPAATPSPSPSPTDSPSPSGDPSPSPVASPTPQPSDPPTPAPTTAPSPSASPTPVPAASSSPSDSPTWVLVAGWTFDASCNGWTNAVWTGTGCAAATSPQKMTSPLVAIGDSLVEVSGEADIVGSRNLVIKLTSYQGGASSTTNLGTLASGRGEVVATFTVPPASEELGLLAQGPGELRQLNLWVWR